VEYWHVGDVGVALPAAALNSIENEIQLLLFALDQIEPLSISN
jgi:hypothetical protein